MNGLVNFKNRLKKRAVAGLEKFLHDRNGGFFVGFGDFNALDPAAQKSFYRIPFCRQKRFADDDGAARIPDRQLREIDKFVKTQLLGFESGVTGDNGAVDRAGFQRSEPFRQSAGLNNATSRSGTRL